MILLIKNNFIRNLCNPLEICTFISEPFEVKGTALQYVCNKYRINLKK